MLRRAANGDRVLHDWWAKACNGRAAAAAAACPVSRPTTKAPLSAGASARPASLFYSPLDAIGQCAGDGVAGGGVRFRSKSSDRLGRAALQHRPLVARVRCATLRVYSVPKAAQAGTRPGTSLRSTLFISAPCSASWRKRPSIHCRALPFCHRARIRAHRAVAGHQRSRAARRSAQALQPGAHLRMRRGRDALREHQPPANTTPLLSLVHHSTTGRCRWLRYSRRLHVARADVQRPERHGAGGQHRLRAAHPVAAMGGRGCLRRFYLARHAGRASDRWSGRRHVGEGLVAEEIVGMQVEVDDLHHRLVRGLGDQRAQLLAVAPGRPGVDHQHAAAGGDEAGVDDVAAVGRREVGVGASTTTPGASARRQAVVKTGRGRGVPCATGWRSGQQQR